MVQLNNNLRSEYVFTLGLTGLVAAYVLLALLLLSINLYSTWSWPVKAATIVITSLFYLIAYFSIPPMLGWPTSAELPQKFKLNAIHVVQPDKLTNEDGIIYLWLTEIDDLEAVGTPRSHELPYSDPLYKAVNKARIKMKKGIEQLGEVKKPEEGAVKIDREGKTTQVSSPIKFYDLPDPIFPEK